MELVLQLHVTAQFQDRAVNYKADILAESLWEVMKGF